MTSTEITTKRASVEQLKALASIDDVRALARDLGAQIIPSSELGDGFTLEDDKSKLVGVPCVFVGWSFSEGDHGEFVTARVVVDRGDTIEKVVINDGSTGIHAQLKAINADDSGAPQMLYAPRGLRKSEYTALIPDQKTGEMKETRATTFYVDTSARGR